MSSYPEPPELYFYTATARFQISASHCVKKTMQNWKDLGFHGRQFPLIMLVYIVQCNLNTHIMSWRGLTICQQTASLEIPLLCSRALKLFICLVASHNSIRYCRVCSQVELLSYQQPLWQLSSWKPHSLIKRVVSIRIWTRHISGHACLPPPLQDHQSTDHTWHFVEPKQSQFASICHVGHLQL